MGPPAVCGAGVLAATLGGEADTCFGYDSWHYRWIGREAAAEQRASGLSFRRFLARHLDG